MGSLVRLVSPYGLSERVNDIFEKSTVTFVSAMLVRVVSFNGLSEVDVGR